jgi:hypothetical protein
VPKAASFFAHFFSFFFFFTDKEQKSVTQFLSSVIDRNAAAFSTASDAAAF